MKEPLRRSSGFTLIELLVVIAIIAILAGLLLPALSSAKLSSLRIKCTSQQKQILLAAIMYETDFNDSSVFPNWGTINPGWLYTPRNGVVPPLSNPPELAYQSGLLWDYVGKNYLIYRCPADNTNTATFAARPEKLSTYVMNGAIMAYHPVPPDGRVHKWGDFDPAAYVLWEPNDQPPDNDPASVYNDGANQPDQSDGPSRRHVKGGVVGSFDGHVQVLKFDSYLTQLENPAGQRTLVWCDPDSANGKGWFNGSNNGCGLWSN